MSSGISGTTMRARREGGGGGVDDERTGRSGRCGPRRSPPFERPVERNDWSPRSLLVRSLLARRSPVRAPAIRAPARRSLEPPNGRAPSEGPRSRTLERLSPAPPRYPLDRRGAPERASPRSLPGRRPTSPRSARSRRGPPPDSPRPSPRSKRPRTEPSLPASPRPAPPTPSRPDRPRPDSAGPDSAGPESARSEACQAPPRPEPSCSERAFRSSLSSGIVCPFAELCARHSRQYGRQLPHEPPVTARRPRRPRPRHEAPPARTPAQPACPCIKCPGNARDPAFTGTKCPGVRGAARGLPHNDEEPPNGRLFAKQCPAATYSPTPSRVQYHRR